MKLWKLTWGTLRPEIVCQPGFSFITNPKFPCTHPGDPPNPGQVEMCHSPGEQSLLFSTHDTQCESSVAEAPGTGRN